MQARKTSLVTVDKPDNDTEVYVGIKEAAALLGIQRRRMQDYVGRIPTKKVFTERTGKYSTLFAQSALKRVIEDRKHAQQFGLVRRSTGGLGTAAPQLPSVIRVEMPAAAEPRDPAYWLTLEEAQTEKGLPIATLLALIQDGRLPAMDVGIRPGGRWRVRRDDLDQLRAPIKK